MTAWKKKLGATLGALALMAGAVPGTVGTAAAVDRGQHLIRGGPYAWQIALVLAGLIGVFFAVKGGSDKPASP